LKVFKKNLCWVIPSFAESNDQGPLCRVQHSAKWQKIVFFIHFLHSITTNRRYHIYISHPSKHISHICHIHHIYHIHHNI
jgi:hypothetical protein